MPSLRNDTRPRQERGAEHAHRGRACPRGRWGRKPPFDCQAEDAGPAKAKNPPALAVGRSQAALLLSLIDSPDEEAKRLHSSNDRKRILRLHELLAADSDYWSSLDQTHRQDGIDTLDTLTDWAKGEHH